MAKTIRSITAHFLKKYELELPKYKEAARLAEKLVGEILAAAPVHIHAITSRYKRLPSLRLKLRNKKYRVPGRQLTDKVGVRVITYFESDLAPIVELLERELEIDEHKSEDKRTKLSLREFGYLSVHLVVRSKGRWSRLQEFEPIRGMWFEIQVRSILEHAWAEIEHEVIYKSGIVFENETKRRFARLAGALEILESEFLALRKERWHLVDRYVDALQKERKLIRDGLDSAKLIAMLEVERPGRVGWRTTPVDAGMFPPGIEAICAEALRSSGIKSASALRRVLRSKTVKTAEKNFSTFSLDSPTHLATALIVVATRSPVIFRDFFPEMASNPAMAPLLKRRSRKGD
jgi:ppGpp synthetase/RelA/SpoT-type nucleotidyltranferase